MRTFEHFPQDAKCLLCGESGDGECILVGIDGTGDGSIEQAMPIHTGCIRLRYNENAGVVYQQTTRKKEGEKPCAG